MQVWTGWTMALAAVQHISLESRNLSKNSKGKYYEETVKNRVPLLDSKILIVISRDNWIQPVKLNEGETDTTWLRDKKKILGQVWLLVDKLKFGLEPNTYTIAVSRDRRDTAMTLFKTKQ